MVKLMSMVNLWLLWFYYKYYYSYCGKIVVNSVKRLNINLGLQFEVARVHSVVLLVQFSACDDVTPHLSSLLHLVSNDNDWNQAETDLIHDIFANKATFKQEWMTRKCDPLRCEIFLKISFKVYDDVVKYSWTRISTIQWRIEECTLFAQSVDGKLFFVCVWGWVTRVLPEEPRHETAVI